MMRNALCAHSCYLVPLVFSVAEDRDPAGPHSYLYSKENTEPFRKDAASHAVR